MRQDEAPSPPFPLGQPVLRVLKGIGVRLLQLLYRVEVRGLDNWKAAGSRVVVCANHVSYLDGPLLALLLPGNPIFAVDADIARQWWIKPFLSFAVTVSITHNNPHAIRSLTKLVRKGNRVILFPEGRLSSTGGLMRVYPGASLIALHGDATILPICIEGPEQTFFSRLGGFFPHRFFPRMTVTILPPRRIAPPKSFRCHGRRWATEALQGIMRDARFESAPRYSTLMDALLVARQRFGGDHVVLEDFNRNPMNYRRLLGVAITLGRHLAKQTRKGEVVALMLPNSVGAAVAFFALQSIGRVPLFLNFTAGDRSLHYAMDLAGCHLLLTSSRFIEAASLAGQLQSLSQTVTVVDLESLRAQVGWRQKGFAFLAGMAANWLPHLVLPHSPTDTHAPALILFTSGSEGDPKGVVLSHANILANAWQLNATADFTPRDIVFNALPTFHVFGLVTGIIMPILGGLKSFLYPSPLHYQSVVDLVYDTGATIFLSTDTFLNGYARKAHHYDFHAVRLLFSGAERLRPETIDLWWRRFGVRIFEGYGATETSAVISINTPLANREGSLGRLLPGIDHRLEPVSGISEGGRLFVRGPNIMSGYLNPAQPGQLSSPPQGWYDTGDLVLVDDEGYLTLLGRLKRFAKVGGEMISLPRVEALLVRHWPNGEHSVVAVRDSRRGEILVLVTTCGEVTHLDLAALMRQEGMPELAIPRRIVVWPTLPRLGSGKIDYPALERVLQQ